MSDDNSKSDLPTPSLQLDPETQRIIEASKVKKFIGPLIVKAHVQKLQKLAVMSWDSEESTKVAAQVLAVAMSQQLDRKCALVIVEGIRFNCELYDSFAKITLPEIESTMISERLANFVEDMEKNYPFQILVGPNIKNWADSPNGRFTMATNADAQILLVPEAGHSRKIMQQVERFTKEKKVNWLGMIAVQGSV